MFKAIGAVFLILSGTCIAAIGLRKKTKLFGKIPSAEYNINIDSFDKYLAIISLIFFILAMIFLVLL